MIYAIGYREFSEERRHKFIIEKHITKEEYDNHRTLLGDAQKVKAMDNIYKLLDRNGKEFLKHSSEINEYIKKDGESIYLEANRLLINYLSSLSMFIDYGEKYNKKHFGKESMKVFQDKTHTYYDSHVSYRFMALMRNYAMHYGFPLLVVNQSISGPHGIFASRELLLKFKSWKHATKDIEKMPDLISLDIHVEVTMMFIKQLYESYIYDIGPVVLKGIEYLDGMIKNNGGNMPLFATFKNKEEFEKGNVSINILEAKQFYESYAIIKSHPSIDIIEK